MNGENPQRERLEAGQLRERIGESTQKALELGVLQSIPTDYELLEQSQEVKFLVRILTNLQRKDAAISQQKQNKRVSGSDFNPFLPYEEELWVGDISDTHVCILNKFNVVNEHLLIITRDFQSQECLLNQADFAAIAFCLREMDGLVFYNGGKLAGASQKHKHLQMVPLPIIPGGVAYPLAPSYDRSFLSQRSQLPFLHAVGRIKSKWLDNGDDFAKFAWDLYQQLLNQIGINAGENNLQSQAYNLLLTRETMVIVPRSQEDYRGISINSLGFAGALLVRDREQMQTLKAIGGLNLLTHVGISGQQAIIR